MMANSGGIGTARNTPVLRFFSVSKVMVPTVTSTRSAVRARASLMRQPDQPRV